MVCHGIAICKLAKPWCVFFNSLLHTLNILKHGIWLSKLDHIHSLFQPVFDVTKVGIGAFVLNERMEVLTVQERNGPLKGTGVWKFPTGVINAGEDIGLGAEREVLEETVRGPYQTY